MSDTVVRRNSKHRQAILDELHSRQNHPTAIELFQRLRQQLPHISLGTVYRNLEILTVSGEILKLSCGQQESRFDSTVDPHTHVCCDECHRVVDIDLVVPALDDLVGQDLDGFEITGHTLYMHGVCRSCLRSA